MVYRPQETCTQIMKIVITYMQNPFTSPTFTKMSTSHTQNEITLKGSEIVFTKIEKSSKAALLNHLKFHPVYFS